MQIVEPLVEKRSTLPLAMYGSSTAANNTGQYNTAIGDEALWSNSSGNNNTASGFQVLFFNTTGYENTASGAAALSYNTSGSYNTASGVYALLNNTTGNYNTAFGMVQGMPVPPLNKIGYSFSGVDKPQENGGLYGLRYAEFTVPLVKAVQELSAENEEQKSEIEKLNKENEYMKSEIAKLKAAVEAIIGNSDK